MSDRPVPIETPPAPDELNRLWQHGMHEERLFHDRLNYFTAMQVGLLAVFAVLYNKGPELGVFIPVTVVALAFTILWAFIQARHWRYCVHVNEHIKRAIPEYRRTLAGFAGSGWKDGLSISRPLAIAVPVLFAVTWLSLLAWVVFRS